MERGSDERQYCAPGIDLPVVCFCRSKFGRFPEYHTSLDDMMYVSAEGFQGSYDLMCEVINTLEYNDMYKCVVKGEPQLGKRGLYPKISKKGSYDEIFIIRDVLAYADGSRDLIEISNKIKKPIKDVVNVTKKLMEYGLLERIKK